MPDVSVVIPTYNRADMLGETLDSVASQTFADWECIVVDDGSTDDTRALVETYARRDPRFRYVWQENASCAAARNHGVRVAEGRYIAFLDSDDLFRPDKLEWQVRLLDDNPDAVMVYGNTWMFTHGEPERGRLYQENLTDKPAGDAFEQLLVCSSIYAPLVRTSVFRQTRGFDEEMKCAEDWDAWLELSKFGKTLFEPRIALDYRVHSGNKSGASLHHVGYAMKVFRRHVKDVPLRRRWRMWRGIRRYFRSEYLTRRLLREAHALNLQGDWPRARHCLRALLWLKPGLLVARRAWPNALWALLPTQAPPLWSRIRHRARYQAGEQGL